LRASLLLIVVTKSHRERTDIEGKKPFARVYSQSAKQSPNKFAAALGSSCFDRSSQSDAPPLIWTAMTFIFCAALASLPATPRQSGSMFVGVCESDRSKRLPLSG
jgi:hypothetical protein